MQSFSVVFLSTHIYLSLVNHKDVKNNRQQVFMSCRPGQMTECPLPPPPTLTLNIPLALVVVLGWIYYHISDAMQNSNTALETATTVRYDPNTCFYVVPLILMHMDLRISKMSIMYQKHHENYCYNARNSSTTAFLSWY